MGPFCVFLETYLEKPVPYSEYKRVGLQLPRHDTYSGKALVVIDVVIDSGPEFTGLLF